MFNVKMYKHGSKEIQIVRSNPLGGIRKSIMEEDVCLRWAINLSKTSRDVGEELSRKWEAALTEAHACKA